MTDSSAVIRITPKNVLYFFSKEDAENFIKDTKKWWIEPEADYAVLHAHRRIVFPSQDEAERFMKGIKKWKIEIATAEDEMEINDQILKLTADGIVH